VEGETLDQLLVAADQAMYRDKSSHKLEKLSKQVEIASGRVVDLENDELASVSVN
jgi:hypothetical protein